MAPPAAPRFQRLPAMPSLTAAHRRRHLANRRPRLLTAVSILEKFILLGVEMLPRLDGERRRCAPPTPAAGPDAPDAQHLRSRASGRALLALLSLCCRLPPSETAPPGFVDPGPANLVALTEGVHSKEALELVREHLLGVMGPAAGRQFSSELIKMSKFQIAQVGARGGRWEDGKEGVGGGAV